MKPPEAEWEHACLAGSQKAYGFGSDANQLGMYAWHRDNLGEKTHPVGQKKPNAWGLYDMHGNVREWCQDWYGEYSSGFAVDPVGPNGGLHRLQRGGAWGAMPNDARCAERSSAPPAPAHFRIGFRLVRAP